MAKPISLYELVGGPDQFLSPYCWATKFAVAHKRLPIETVCWKLNEGDKIAFSKQGLVGIPHSVTTWISPVVSKFCVIHSGMHGNHGKLPFRTAATQHELTTLLGCRCQSLWTATRTANG